MLKMDRIKTPFSLVGKGWKRINRPVVTSLKHRIFLALIIAVILFVLLAIMIVLGISSVVSEAAENPPLPTRSLSGVESGPEELPLYPGIVSGSKQEIESLVNEVPVTTILFGSLDPPHKITEFYKDRMSKKGWKIIQPMEKSQLIEQGIDVSQIPDINTGQGLFLILKKGNATCSIAALENTQFPFSLSHPPTSSLSRLSRDAVTAVYIRRSADDISYGSSTEDAPGKGLANISRYPRAIRKTSIEMRQGEGGTALIYESQDSLRDIVAFYRKDMTRRGWQPLSFPQRKKAEARLIFFQNKKGENCLVSVVPTQGTNSSQIVILYNKRGF